MDSKPLLLFDMDGTLIKMTETPSRHVPASSGDYVSVKQRMREIAVNYGVPGNEMEGLDRMSHIWNAVRAYAEENDYGKEKIRCLMEELNVPFMDEENSDHQVSVLIPGTIEALEELKEKGYRLGLVTTASRGSLDRISNSPDYGCFGRFFEYTVARDECCYVKPHPESLRKALAWFNTERFVYVGDSDHDALATEAAGGVFVLINTRGFDEAVTKRMNAVAVIHSLRELHKLLSDNYDYNCR
ncbi:MAG: HAD family hydrolase [Candidatus Bathyarchaeota archaeon]|nr:HAD family hydrolase [Candidatus Bathyarchaeota archaeon]